MESKLETLISCLLLAAFLGLLSFSDDEKNEHETIEERTIIVQNVNS